MGNVIIIKNKWSPHPPCDFIKIRLKCSFTAYTQYLDFIEHAIIFREI